VFNLSRGITTNQQAFSDLGMEIAKNADGTTNLEETLFIVVAAYNQTDDAARRNQIALTAFGKAGNELIDVLEVGDARLRQLAGSTKKCLHPTTDR
jgi:hypothetical protein